MARRGSVFAMNTVLLIDDDEGILAAFGLALRNHGYRVFEASTGTAGFELAKQQLPDIIITDIAMPGGDGEDLLRRIRQHPDLANKQVVLMTGEVHHLGPRRGMEVGADDFLAKPVSLEALLSCVEARLKRAQVHWRVEDRALERLRTSLHSNLPHEFFTPLGGILGLTDILRAEWEALPPTEVKDLLGDIHLSALRLHRTLRNYLMVLELREESDPAKLPPPLPAYEVEERIGSGVRTAARRHGRKTDIEVRIEPCSILVHPDDLSVLVEELVDNACQYSRQKTPVKIELRRDGVLTVTDTGRGMTAEELQQIGIFRQFERPGKEQQGLGIGLVLVQRLAAKCGTKPVIESTVGQGTKIRVAFLKPPASGK
jgi:two-component system sensor histidine kinase/response regulator